MECRCLPAGCIKSLPDVVTVGSRMDYKLALSSTVPYIGAAAVHAAGETGAGEVFAEMGLKDGSPLTVLRRNLPGREASRGVRFERAYYEDQSAVPRIILASEGPHCRS